MAIPPIINMDVGRYNELITYLKAKLPNVLSYLNVNPVVFHSMVTVSVDVYAQIADDLFGNMDYELAEPMFRSLVIRIMQACTNDDPPPSIIMFIEKLANCLFNLYQIGYTDKLEEIEPLMKQVIAMKIREYGKFHRSTIESITDMGSFYVHVGRYIDALTLFDGIISAHYKVKDMNYQYFLDTLMECVNHIHCNKYRSIAHNIAKSVGIAL